MGKGSEWSRQRDTAVSWNLRLGGGGVPALSAQPHDRNSGMLSELPSPLVEASLRATQSSRHVKALTSILTDLRDLDPHRRTSLDPIRKSGRDWGTLGPCEGVMVPGVDQPKGEHKFAKANRRRQTFQRILEKSLQTQQQAGPGGVSERKSLQTEGGGEPTGREGEEEEEEEDRVDTLAGLHHHLKVPLLHLSTAVARAVDPSAYSSARPMDGGTASGGATPRLKTQRDFRERTPRDKSTSSPREREKQRPAQPSLSTVSSSPAPLNLVSPSESPPLPFTFSAKAFRPSDAVQRERTAAYEKRVAALASASPVWRGCDARGSKTAPMQHEPPGVSHQHKEDNEEDADLLALKRRALDEIIQKEADAKNASRSSKAISSSQPKLEEVPRGKKETTVHKKKSVSISDEIEDLMQARERSRLDVLSNSPSLQSLRRHIE
uniref:Uncharacterized protein n=1 Tax=Chromera velia CCMP2878 TaxID=1169474 RepID=A0A0G4I8B9_9ALVE|eukprot:Cvel_11904.t1-p1 / transcript=Cvel_11904.t1 / gene=Cvel_11904 / organism=Chromera_velia_CCMP2878 / gene_product=hypothetical protein / transcript_product=hypothetical protein / location=Cvel_scaffold762:162-5510(+) / protein_length=435 / sequence_SO=supercontig / SO=protein_coding / is_pseudo=false